MIWEDGKKISDARANEDGSITPAVYQGNTPITAYNLNKAQEELKKEVGIKNVTGTEEETIDANTLTDIGIYRVSGNKTNFYNNDIDGFIMFTSFVGNNTIIQNVFTENGMATRTGNYSIVEQNMQWDFSEWKNYEQLEWETVDTW